jgi:phosphotriesterase-related protein
VAQGFVRTVCGDVDPASLGVTYGHEHLFTRPAPRLRDGGDLVLDDEDKAVAELNLFVRAGGRSLVEATTPEFGRDLGAIRRISERAGVHVVAVTGHASRDYWGDVIDLDGQSEDELAEEMLRDLTGDGEGVGGPRAGAIKVGTSLDAIAPAEARLLRAAARAQAETSAPITTHTTAGTMALEQARALIDAGADPARVCIGHVDRRLVWKDHLALARTGVTLGYDCASKDWYEPDARRVEFVLRLFDAGFGDRLCLSGDLARRSSLVSWGGGPGYVHILWRLVPWLRREGLADSDVRRLLVDNPRRLLTWTTTTVRTRPEGDARE